MKIKGNRKSFEKTCNRTITGGKTGVKIGVIM